MTGRPSRRRIRLLAPVGVAAAIGLGAGVPAVLPAAASPHLPAQTAAQLLARAERPAVAGFHGEVQWTANLGLPDLSALTAGGGAPDNGTSGTALLSGTHQVKVWDAGAGGERLALLSPAGESDLYVSSAATGRQTWWYDSSSNTATHLVPAPGRASAGAGHRAGDATPALTPQQVAHRLLSQVERYTAVSVSPATYIAGQPAYVLGLAPRAGAPGSASSTVGRVAIAIDAANGAVLNVSVTPKGATTPALSVGFTSVTFQAPKAIPPFRPAAGTRVTTRVAGVPAAPTGSPGQHPASIGAGWGTVVVARGGTSGLSPSARRQLGTVTTPLSGTFGTGRLLSSSLVNVLLLPDGQVLAGFVTPHALAAAAAQATAG